MAICDRHGLPVAVHVASASPYEPHLVPATLDARFLADLPTRLIGDRGYDSDALDERLMTQYGIEMIAAHRWGRRSTQDAVRSVTRADAGRSNGCSRGSTTRVVSSRAGNVMSTTSWACCISPAPESSSGIYEMTSSQGCGAWNGICTIASRSTGAPWRSAGRNFHCASARIALASSCWSIPWTT